MCFCFITKAFMASSSSNGAFSFAHLFTVLTAALYSLAICAMVRFSRLPLALASSSSSVRCSAAVSGLPALTLVSMLAMLRLRIASNGICLSSINWIALHFSLCVGKRFASCFISCLLAGKLLPTPNNNIYICRC